MKKLLLFAAAVAAAGLLGWLPAEPRALGDLLVVEALVASEENGVVTVDGGKGLMGRGGTWAEAVDDLRQTANGDAFLDTAGHILLKEEAMGRLDEVLDDRRLRPAARVYLAQGSPTADGVVEFLRSRQGSVTIRDLQAAWLEGRTVTLPVLREEEGRYRLAEDG